jgi:hypothetical protein
MKKIFLAASLLLAATTFTGTYSANAKAIAVMAKKGVEIPASQVPVAVRASFASNFPNARNVQWEKQREDGGLQYQADFNMNGKRFRARFSPDGTLLSVGPR